MGCFSAPADRCLRVQKIRSQAGNRIWDLSGTAILLSLIHIYYERVQETGTYLDTVAASTDQAEPKTVQDFLDRIENQDVYKRQDMDLLCIDHCREGRIEQEVGQNAFSYLPFNEQRRNAL